eukprot:12406740-Karenia_brevis.AAC.1
MPTISKILLPTGPASPEMTLPWLIGILAIAMVMQHKAASGRLGTGARPGWLLKPKRVEC